jgi:glutamine amidotransferase-like uncharacterized protein
MSESRKVFIYNDIGTAQPSVNDLNKLFLTSESIFPSRPDIVMGNFAFNMDGLVDPVFVVPGGSTSAIGLKLKPQIDRIKYHYKKNFSYIGVCAGAYLGAANAELYLTTHRLDQLGMGFEEAPYVVSTQNAKIALNMIEDFQAFGAFYPDQSHLGTPRKEVMPYRVSLSLSATQKELSQLYLAGPAFVSRQMPDEKSSTDVVATYVGYRNYTLFKQNTSDKPLAAIVRTLPEEKIGGKLLAATHIETCIESSELLSIFKSGTSANAALGKETYRLLVEEQEGTRAFVESLLRDTLKVRKN